jgi:hypothetical protein
MTEEPNEVTATLNAVTGKLNEATDKLNSVTAQLSAETQYKDGTVVPVHAKKAQDGCGRLAPLIRKLDCTRSPLVSFNPLQLYRGTRCPVQGTRYQLPDTRCPVPMWVLPQPVCIFQKTYL